MSAFMSVTARRAAAAALAAGALVGTFAASASADAGGRPHRDRVEISGAQYDSPGWDNGTNRSLNKEWVDVTNTSRHAVNLDGWTLSARDGRTYTFHHYRLAGRATVRVHTGVGRDSGRDVYQDRRRYAWDNRSDTATLRDDRNRRVDTLSWGGHRDDRDDRGHHGDDRGHHGDDRGHRGGHR
ncbi:lamin tail domain-containing protein [Streptomyces sp. NPDC056910]|uniref:lamin tail domain-containing protein n=1 Tax=unclassified Streptomyces TaxID=2593676 RepID=UPI003675C87D